MTLHERLADVPRDLFGRIHEDIVLDRMDWRSQEDSKVTKEKRRFRRTADRSARDSD